MTLIESCVGALQEITPDLRAGKFGIRKPDLVDGEEATISLIWRGEERRKTGSVIFEVEAGRAEVLENLLGIPFSWFCIDPLGNSGAINITEFIAGTSVRERFSSERENFSNPTLTIQTDTAGSVSNVSLNFSICRAFPGQDHEEHETESMRLDMGRREDRFLLQRSGQKVSLVDFVRKKEAQVVTLPRLFTPNLIREKVLASLKTAVRIYS